MEFQVGHFFHFQTRNSPVSIDEKQTKQTERRIYKWKQSVA